MLNVLQTRMSVPPVHVEKMPNVKTKLVPTVASVRQVAQEIHFLDVCVEVL